MSDDEVTRDELPVPDYDHLPVGSLGHRIRSLEAEDLDVLRRYEEAHANRPAVLQILDHRLLDLAEGQRPSGGDATAPAAEAAPAAAAAETSAPETGTEA
ncbi:hypothetical protein HF998_03020 [Cellulomonas hominis]|nr:hypothetical protein [Cellulomonas hominis]